jgi:SAM-dependent methyltransferase
MVEVCKAKAEKDFPSKPNEESASGAAANRGRFATLEVRVEDAGKMRFKSGFFDTVVDTFGLCSYEDPVAVLREMARVCRRSSTSKSKTHNGKVSGGGGGGGGEDADDGGRLFLLEHGRSETHGWLSNILDKFAMPHAAKWAGGAVTHSTVPSHCQPFHSRPGVQCLPAVWNEGRTHSRGVRVGYLAGPTDCTIRLH